MTNLAVVGAGSWGTALALVLARRGYATRLTGRNAERIAKLAEARENRAYLPGHQFPDCLVPTPDTGAALDNIDFVIVAVPSHALRATLTTLAPHLPTHCGIVWATKGLEPGTAKLPHEVAAETLGPERPLGVLSGPSFADEVAAGLPTAVTVAATDQAFAEHVAMCCHDGAFRVYATTDVAGVGVGGAVKNVLAIAVGFADGLGYRANTRALLITRGLRELTEVGAELGAHADTLTGMAGLGDLLLTCGDDQSRNRRFGLLLAAGRSVEAAEREIGQTVEGVRVAHALYELALARGLDVPIIAEAYQVLYGGRPPAEAAARLMERPFRPPQR
ncbi:NAD(P)H-dependent glycerol-3-phosphate dehydrogenase [Salinisphaera orenii]|uniref:NAD(P)H-dependent glycerol-3-phosphate dehydrogenase n=1 Tax=Salinisphaera orenii TaxID=856731 RepID=UPI000DBE2610